jgi:hypothetical protein
MYCLFVRIKKLIISSDNLEQKIQIKYVAKKVVVF